MFQRGCNHQPGTIYTDSNSLDTHSQTRDESRCLTNLWVVPVFFTWASVLLPASPSASHFVVFFHYLRNIQQKLAYNKSKFHVPRLFVDTSIFFGGARFRQLSNVVHKSCPKSNQRSLWIWYQVGLGCMTRLYELPDQLRHFRVQDLGRWWTWEYVRQMDPFSDEILRFDTSMYWISKEQQLHIVIYIYISIYISGTWL